MKKKYIIIAIIIFLVILVGVVGFTLNNNKNNKNFTTNYNKELQLIADNTIQDASIHSIYLQILQVGALNGVDFDKSYTSFIDASTRKQLAEAKESSRSNDKVIVDTMKQLKKHSSKYDSAYKDIQQVFSDYNSLQNSTINVSSYVANDTKNALDLSKRITDKLTELKKLGLD